MSFGYRNARSTLKMKDEFQLRKRAGIALKLRDGIKAQKRAHGALKMIREFQLQ